MYASILIVPISLLFRDTVAETDVQLHAVSDTALAATIAIALNAS